MSEESFKNKYLKYKNKYVYLKKQLGGGDPAIHKVPTAAATARQRVETANQVTVEASYVNTEMRKQMRKEVSYTVEDERKLDETAIKAVQKANKQHIELTKAKDILMELISTLNETLKDASTDKVAVNKAISEADAAMTLANSAATNVKTATDTLQQTINQKKILGRTSLISFTKQR